MFDAAPVMDRWIEALESGEYEQCYERFQDGESYCALGLLAKVAGIPIQDPIDSRADNYSGIRQFISLDIQGLMIEFNDDLRMTFPQIAAWLRNRV